MKILIDESMLYAKSLFCQLGDVKAVAGRTINASMLEDVNALIVRSVTRVDSTLLSNSQVTFVGTATSGVDHVDLDWLRKEGINFSAAHGCNAIAVVEYVFSVLLWLAQRDNFSLHDKTVGIIGVGNIGSCLQQRLNAFGVSTLLCDPPLQEVGTPGDWQPLEKLVAEADILTFHIPLTYSGQHATWHLVDETFLAALPAGRTIINTCRGAVIDNNALLVSLEKGKHLNVILDVWESEPKLLLPLLNKVDIGTAHIAGYTLEGRIRGTTQIFNAYSTFMGSDVRTSITALLLQPIVKFIRLRNVIHEETLHFLAHLVYDVQRDNLRFHPTTCFSSEFDRLRKNYYQRREWSSLCIETDDDYNSNILKKLGFQIRVPFS